MGRRTDLMRRALPPIVVSIIVVGRAQGFRHGTGRHRSRWLTVMDSKHATSWGMEAFIRMKVYRISTNETVRKNTSTLHSRVNPIFYTYSWEFRI